MVIQDDLYSGFAKHVKTICLEMPRQLQIIAWDMSTITDKILYSPTRVMLRGAVDQRFYNPITELKE